MIKEKDVLIFSLFVFLILSVVLALESKPFYTLPEYVELKLTNYTKISDENYLLSFEMRNTGIERNFTYTITVSEDGSEFRYLIKKGWIVLNNETSYFKDNVSLLDLDSTRMINDKWKYEVHFWTKRSERFFKIAVEIYE